MADIDSLIDPLSAHLTLPGHVCGPACEVVRLRPPQAAGLAEMHDYGGLFLQGRVGLGKTLITMLLGPLMSADRIMLIVPANLKEKTFADFRVLRQHWVCLPVRVESYELFGRDQAKDILPKYFAGAQRGMLILDECQEVKNRRAGCTRKIDRFVAAWREAGHSLNVGAMSGTTAKRSLKDFQHVIKWCFPDTCPLPLETSDLDDWASAVDEKVPDQNRVDPGALLSFCNDAERAGDPQVGATTAVGRRIFETPGVIGSIDKGIETPLFVSCVQLPLSPAEDDAFSFLRGDAKRKLERKGWETPDRHPIGDAVALWRHARELALGFFYQWDPRPPWQWLQARQNWCAAVRDILAHNRRELDTEFQVADEVRRAILGRRCPTCKRRTIGHVCSGAEDARPHPEVATTPDPKHHEASEEYEAWHAVKDTFEPNTVPVWVGSTALDYAAEWGRRNVGIIWTEHRAFAHELARRSGLRYFGRGGKDLAGLPIERADPTKSLIASIASNSTGRNLQAWNKSLVTSFPPTGTIVEQMLGREHRDGQKALEVRYDVLIACREQLAGFEQARRDCTFHSHLLQMQPKLNQATIIEPAYTARGFAWAEQKAPSKAATRARLEALRPTG